MHGESVVAELVVVLVHRNLSLGYSDARFKLCKQKKGQHVYCLSASLEVMLVSIHVSNFWFCSLHIVVGVASRLQSVMASVHRP